MAAGLRSAVNLYIILSALFCQSEQLAFRSGGMLANRGFSFTDDKKSGGRQEIQTASLHNGKGHARVDSIGTGSTVEHYVSMVSNQGTGHRDNEEKQAIINGDNVNLNLTNNHTKNSGVTGDTVKSNKQTASPNHSSRKTKGHEEIRMNGDKSLRFKPRLAKCRMILSGTNKTANCSCLELSKVPQDLPRDKSVLIMSHNRLDHYSLAGGPFNRYQDLLFLKLDGNHLSALPDRAFEGLSRLVFLDLHNNTIRMDDNLNRSQAFAPLRHSLLRLIINRNDQSRHKYESMYPDKALSYLSSLKSLEIDGLKNKTFGVHFRKMSNLTSLQMSGYHTGYCDLSYLTNMTFENFPSLTHLNVSDCHINKSMEVSVLEPLVNLELLDVSYNFNLGFRGLGSLMYGQRKNKKLKLLYINVIINRYEPCIIVEAQHLKYFPDLHLEGIQAIGNGIEMIDPYAIRQLPKTLKTVDLRRNKIMMGAYWNELHRLENLQTLLLDGSVQAYKLPFYLPPKFPCASTNEREGMSFSNEHTAEKERFLSLSLPPNLEKVSIRRYYLSYKITKIEFMLGNKLKRLNLHGNYFPQLIGPVLGLDQLEQLDLSNCNVEHITPGFFDNFKVLKTLDLHKNFLGSHLHSNPKESVFCSESLEELHIGLNDIFQLSQDTFKDCTNLRILNINGNRLSAVKFWTKKMTALSHLNLSGNAIATLPQEMMDHFESIIRSGQHPIIDMTLNPIHCDCDNINFLKWVTRTKIFGNLYKNYICFDPNHRTKREMRDGYDEELKLLVRQCSHNHKLLICVVAITLTFFVILIGVVIHRFRWTMRYWYHGGKMMWALETSNASMIEYEHDVFVCYCRQDRQFVTDTLDSKLGTERDLKLLLHDKCFQAGRTVTENTIRAVKQCRKTLVVVSKAMLSSSLWNRELEIARQEAISTGRDVLVFLFLENINNSSLDPDLSEYIRSNVFAMYPDNPAELDAFWDKLAADLKS